MTTLREAVKAVLDRWDSPLSEYAASDLFEELRAALEQPEQEPVAWRYQDAKGNYRYRKYIAGFDSEYTILKPIPLYAQPPQRKPLTDDEIALLYMSHTDQPRKAYWEFVRAIEQAHGIGGKP